MLRKKLEKLATDFVGFDPGQVEEMTDTKLIIEILEVVTDKIEKLDGHTHTIN